MLNCSRLHRMADLSPRSRWTRLGRVYQACQAQEEAAYNKWLRGLTDEELEELVRLGNVCEAVAEGLLPDDAWTQQQARLFTEAVNRGKR